MSLAYNSRSQHGILISEDHKITWYLKIINCHFLITEDHKMTRFDNFLLSDAICGLQDCMLDQWLGSRKGDIVFLGKCYTFNPSPWSFSTSMNFHFYVVRFSSVGSILTRWTKYFKLSLSTNSIMDNVPTSLLMLSCLIDMFLSYLLHLKYHTLHAVIFLLCSFFWDKKKSPLDNWRS